MLKKTSIYIRISEEEKVKIKREADKAERSLSSWVLWVCRKFTKTSKKLKEPVKPKPSTDPHDKVYDWKIK